MTLILVFGAALLLAVLLSERARTSVLSTSVLFLVVGIVVGPLTGIVDRTHARGDVIPASELALFTILFVDGAQLSCKQILDAWRLPGRALLVGLPLTIGATALAAHIFVGTSWLVSFLIGAVLSPTDPVMVRTILEHEAVPARLRRLLSVESGLNDGLALPPIMILLAIHGAAPPDPALVILETLGGVAVGIAVASLTLLERLPGLSISERYRPLLGIAVACITYGVGKLTHTNEFLAAFSAGVTLSTLRDDLASELVSVGEPISEALKLGALLLFGTTLVFDLDGRYWLFAVVTLLATRPVALAFALAGGGLSRKEWAVAAWFGPKGFASLLYAALLVSTGIPDATTLFHVVGLVIALSVLVHSSTDSLIAKTFTREPSSASASAPA